MPCNKAVLGALSRLLKNIRLGFGVTLTPHEFIHPARIAEKVATSTFYRADEWGGGSVCLHYGAVIHLSPDRFVETIFIPCSSFPVAPLV